MPRFLLPLIALMGVGIFGTNVQAQPRYSANTEQNVKVDYINFSDRKTIFSFFPAVESTLVTVDPKDSISKRYAHVSSSALQKLVIWERGEWACVAEVPLSLWESFTPSSYFSLKSTVKIRAIRKADDSCCVDCL